MLYWFCWWMTATLDRWEADECRDEVVTLMTPSMLALVEISWWRNCTSHCWLHLMAEVDMETMFQGAWLKWLASMPLTSP
jgi:hypothetical protein